jgi:hypothetical protein
MAHLVSSFLLPSNSFRCVCYLEERNKEIERDRKEIEGTRKCIREGPRKAEKNTRNLPYSIYGAGACAVLVRCFCGDFN